MVKCALLLLFLLAASSLHAYGYVSYGETALRTGKARYLSNDLTRFTSVDPAASFNPSNPQSWNRYAYSLNDPINRIDPDGRVDLSFTSFKREARATGLYFLGLTIVATGYAPAPFSKGAPPTWLQEAINSVTPDQQIALAMVGGVRGGKGPVLKGQEGVAQSIADAEKAGETLKGKEITLETSGGRTRLDILTETADELLQFIESKKGPNARLTPNQKVAIPLIESEGAIPRGANAEKAGLKPGEPIGPTKVKIDYHD